MAELTPKEKAVLSSLVYIDNGNNIWKTMNNKKLIDIVNELEKNSNGDPGGLNLDDCRDVIRAVKNSPNLSQLELVNIDEKIYKKYHTKGSDARILAFRNGNNPVVVFAGLTGVTEALDCINGGVVSDTDAQKRALAYINTLHEQYGWDNITTIGHSKGGNKAMYVNVLSDYVADSFAVDSPGFSQAFRSKYKQRIEMKKNSMTMIAADQSIVSGFLRPIAGNITYISTEGFTAESTRLGWFDFHKSNLCYTVDDEGNVHFGEESRRAIVPDLVNLVTEMISVGGWIPQAGAEILQLAISEIIDGSGDPFSLSIKIGKSLVGMFPDLVDGIGGILTSVGNLFGVEEDGIDFSRFPLFAGAVFVTSLAGVSGFASAGIILAKVILAAVVVMAVIKVLEQVLPVLLKSGIEAAKAIGLAVGMAASWIGEQLANIGKAVVDGFHKAIDGTVQLGKMAVDAAKAVKDALSNAVRSFLSDAGKFFENIGKGAKNWINGVFGSTGSAIQYAQNINVTMSRIEEMQRHISNLRQCYTNARGTTNNASSTVNRVQSYYNESYVRSCCRDIQNNLKKAQNYINSAERELDRKRKILLTAAESYRNADQEAVKIARSYN